MHLVVGLGNPGERYAHTRHNVAWRVLDELAARHAASDCPGHATYRARQVTVGEHAVELLQPLTFMNLSGEALATWRERNGKEAELLVVSDDVYLPLGGLRIRASGSSGGHRGLEHIEAALQSREYTRLRIGVGEQLPEGDLAASTTDLKQYVLDEFAAEELPVLEQAVRRAADAVECWISEGARGAMKQFNRRRDPVSGSVREEETET